MVIPSLWDSCRRCCHAQENSEQQLPDPATEQRLFPPSCVPVMTSTGLTRQQFKGLEHRVLLQMGRNSPSKEVAAKPR